MLIGKSFVCYSKIDRDPVSVLLEAKGRSNTLLFESGAIAELCKYNLLSFYWREDHFYSTHPFSIQVYLIHALSYSIEL